MTTPRRAIFLDRDGVLNEVIDRGDNYFVQEKKVKWTAPWTYSEFHLKPEVSGALQAFRDAGYIVILATNQPDMAYGTMTREDHERIMADVRILPLDDIFVCEHGRDNGCECKKPKPGMLLAAAEKWNIDLTQSYMIGDTESDIIAGRAAGCKVVFVEDGRNSEIETEYRVKTLTEFSKILIDTERI
ncbi:HAD-IIIA family hydrolase [Candidatus Peregrinibacteria bacterium]|nr:HAD-IIIA family hydrolase [Candidatus Peregrinibacteria bacterium]